MIQRQALPLQSEGEAFFVIKKIKMKRINLMIVALFMAVTTFASCDSSDPKTGLTPVPKPEPPSQSKEIRAVWIPDPSHTTALQTYENVKSTVNLLDELNMNMIYVVTWAGSRTAFKSQVLLDNSTHATKEAGYMFQSYVGGYTSPTNDPLKDLITEAHKKGIKVVFWFEYGFMASHGAPTATNSQVFAKHPEWVGLQANKTTVANYNNTDYYFNAYDPEVQKFLLDLIKEAMTLYPDVDGIQGDDRMPAMPINSGYEPSTIARYKAEHSGQEPPQNHADASWVRWRLDILNKFAKEYHATIKAKNANALVCYSPNPYPWSKDNLMQEWPKWIEDGVVDVISVQCYRYTSDAYRSTAKAALDQVKAKTTKGIFNPGVILFDGADQMTEATLKSQMEINRQLGTNGEAFFFNEKLKNEWVKKVLKSFYKEKAEPAVR